MPDTTVRSAELRGWRTAPNRFLNSSDCAYLLGVKPSAVSNWKRRGAGPLPEPSAYVGDNPLWTIDQIAPLAREARERVMEQLRNMETAAALIIGEGWRYGEEDE